MADRWLDNLNKMTASEPLRTLEKSENETDPLLDVIFGNTLNVEPIEADATDPVHVFAKAHSEAVVLNKTVGRDDLADPVLTTDSFQKRSDERFAKVTAVIRKTFANNPSAIAEAIGIAEKMRTEARAMALASA